MRWRADDPTRRPGGLVLEVKGDFCGQVHAMLRRNGREADYVEIGLDTGGCSSLRSALPGDESWRTLLQCFRTKVFLASSDEFTARNAAELCGRRDQLKAHYSVSESGRNAHISLLTGRPTSGQQSLSASKTYAPHHEQIFAPRVFTQLQNAQAIVLPYDGINPLPAQFCYLFQNAIVVTDP
ncbi:MAG: type IV secretion system DNA-binding domain-containing protein [Acidobacteriota bacterium]